MVDNCDERTTKERRKEGKRIASVLCHLLKEKEITTDEEKGITTKNRNKNKKKRKSHQTKKIIKKHIKRENTEKEKLKIKSDNRNNNKKLHLVQ